jgi:hypothetical protein
MMPGSHEWDEWDEFMKGIDNDPTLTGYPVTPGIGPYSPNMLQDRRDRGGTGGNGGAGGAGGGGRGELVEE